MTRPTREQQYKLTMKRPASSLQEHNISQEGSQDSIDPRLLQHPIKRPRLSFAEGENTTYAADGRSIGQRTSGSEHGESTIDDEDATFREDLEEEEEEEDAPQGSQGYAAAPKMAGVGKLAQMHGNTGNIHAGYLSYMRARRTITIPKDDYAELLTSNSHYVREVYNAMTTVPTSMTPEQTRMVTFWGKKLKALGDDADQYMADLASMVIAAIHALHTTGDMLFDAQFESLKPHDDDTTMTALERVDIICVTLHNYKKHMVDLMAGFDDVTKFVAAPKGIAKRKIQYSSNNNSKKKRLTELAAAAALAKSAENKARDEEGGEDDDAQAEDDD